ncbi:MAG: hypothetical protein RIT03_1049 [Bacteroidota bacterium]|jgi:hypothetical protein
MKKALLLLVTVLSFSTYAQEDAWVYFTGKPNAQTFLSNPLTMLSQRALDRRAAQNIPLDIQDVPIHQAYIDQVTAAAGITVMAKSRWLNCLHVRGTAASIYALANLPGVDHLEFADASLNLRMPHAPAQIQPVNKTMEALVTFNYGNSFNQIHMMNGDLLHVQNFTGVGKVVAVLDAGFPGVNTLNPFARLRNNSLLLGGYDFVNKNTNFYTGDSHGTMVLSTMGGYVNNQLVGTAPDAQYYLYITEDVNSENPVEESNWVEAAEMADYVGADIITSSLGYFGFDNTNYGHTYSDMTGNKAFASRGANIAFTRGIIVVASAGNEGASSEPHVGVPAEANNVLAIGAVRSNRNIASFSSIGPSFDGRIKPDLMAQGQASVLSTASGTVGTANGTSFSGPILAGMIATFWSAVPTLTNQEVVNYVKQSADRYANPNNQYGYGIPDFSAALNTALAVSSVSKDVFTVYPNPATTQISVQLPASAQEASITIYTSVGQLVQKSTVDATHTSVSIEQLPAGIYMYQIRSGSQVQAGKLIKN